MRYKTAMPPQDATNDSSCTTCGSWWRLPLLLAIVLVAIVAYRIWQPATLPLKSQAGIAAEEGPNVLPPGAPRVALAIDFGNGERREFAAIGWKQGMTVADLMAQVPELQVVQVVQKGAGAGAFLVSIDGIANSEAESRYWTYEVNGQAADRSFAVQELQPGDRVLWSFGSRR